MIRLGQHRRLPRARLLGEDARAWIVQAAHGAGWAAFMAAAVLLPAEYPLIKAWAQGLRLAIVAGSHVTFLN